MFGLDHASGGKVYSGGADGYVVEWDVEKEFNGNLLATLSESVYAVRVFDQLLLAGTATGFVLAVDLRTKKALFNKKVSPAGIFDFFVSPDRIYVFGEQGFATVLDRDFKTINRKQLLNDSIRQVLPLAGDRFIMACSDNTIKLTDRENLAVFEERDAHEFSVFALALDEERGLLFSGSRDATIKKWHVNELTEIQHIKAHMYHVNGLSLSTGSNLLLSASMDKSIRLWDAETLELLKVVNLRKFGMHTNSVNKVLWIGPNRFISCSDDRTLGYFQVEL